MKDDSDFERISTIDFNLPLDRNGRQSIAVGRTTNNRLSVPLQFNNKKAAFDSTAQLNKEKEEMDEKYGLPDTWARHTQKRTK